MNARRVRVAANRRRSFEKTTGDRQRRFSHLDSRLGQAPVGQGFPPPEKAPPPPLHRRGSRDRCWRVAAAVHLELRVVVLGAQRDVLGDGGERVVGRVDRAAVLGRVGTGRGQVLPLGVPGTLHHVVRQHDEGADDDKEDEEEDHDQGRDKAAEVREQPAGGAARDSLL